MLIIFAAVVGGACWLGVTGPLEAPDASEGISLLDASAHSAVAILLLALAGLPAIGLGIVASGAANPLAGVFAVAAALAVLAAAGGSADGYLMRAESVPDAYGKLAIESVIWLGGALVLLYCIWRLRSAVRVHLPILATDDHFGDATRIRFPRTQALTAGLVAAGIGGLTNYHLIKTPDTGQVIGSLLVGFTIAGLLGQVMVPQKNPVAMLLSPLVVGAAAHLYVSTHSHDAALEAYFDQTLPGLALALPIHYASAGVAGCVLGIGLGQGIVQTRARPAQA